MNELPLDQVLALERVHGGSAVHALAEWNLSDAAEKRWSEIYQAGELDAEDSPQLDIITMTYCIEQVDARRVVVAFDGQTRTVYPLWWDQKHEVSGSNREGTPKPCSHPECHHLPDEG
jgi:hypothetical protein